MILTTFCVWFLAVILAFVWILNCFGCEET